LDRSTIAGIYPIVGSCPTESITTWSITTRPRIGLAVKNAMLVLEKTAKNISLHRLNYSFAKESAKGLEKATGKKWDVTHVDAEEEEENWAGGIIPRGHERRRDYPPLYELCAWTWGGLRAIRAECQRLVLVADGVPGRGRGKDCEGPIMSTKKVLLRKSSVTTCRRAQLESATDKLVRQSIVSQEINGLIRAVTCASARARNLSVRP
jgi:hypothetical protein